MLQCQIQNCGKIGNVAHILRWDTILDIQSKVWGCKPFNQLTIPGARLLVLTVNSNCLKLKLIESQSYCILCKNLIHLIQAATLIPSFFVCNCMYSTYLYASLLLPLQGRFWKLKRCIVPEVKGCLFGIIHGQNTGRYGMSMFAISEVMAFCRHIIEHKQISS